MLANEKGLFLEGVMHLHGEAIPVRGINLNVPAISASDQSVGYTILSSMWFMGKKWKQRHTACLGVLWRSVGEFAKLTHGAPPVET